MIDQSPSLFGRKGIELRHGRTFKSCSYRTENFLGRVTVLELLRGKIPRLRTHVLASRPIAIAFFPVAGQAIRSEGGLPLRQKFWR